MVPSRFAPGLLLVLSLVWGSSWIANSLLADLSDPLRTTALRYLLASFCVALAYGCHSLVRTLRKKPIGHSLKVEPGGTPPAPPATYLDRFSLASESCEKAWLVISIVLGLSMFALPDLLLVCAARHGAAPFTPLIYAALPLGLLVVEGELRHPAILAVGAMLVLLNGSLPLSLNKLAWALLIVAAVSLQGWSLLYARHHLATAASLRGMLLQLITAALVLECALELSPRASQQTPLQNWPTISLGALFLLAVPATAIAYPLYYRLLAWLDPAKVATTFWLQTLVAIGESAWLLRQRPGWMMGAAAGVLVGCAIAMSRRTDADAGASLRLSS